jgi:hypothetical protein
MPDAARFRRSVGRLAPGPFIGSLALACHMLVCNKDEVPTERKEE